MSETFSTIVVGFGRAADGQRLDVRTSRHFAYASHAQVLDAHAAFDWRGVVDPDPDALGTARRDWGIEEVSAELGAIAAAVDPEVAVITAPAAARPAIVEALPSLKAVVVEKPLGIELEDGEALLRTCEARGILVQVNYWRRASPFFRELAAGRLGELVGPCQTAFATYGNGLFNNAGHAVDLVRMVLGEVAEVRALGPAVPLINAPLPGDVQVPLALTMVTGQTVAVHDLDFNHYRELGLDIWGDRGRLTLFQEGLDARHYPVAPHRAVEAAMEVACDTGTGLDPQLGHAWLFLYDNLAAALRGETDLWSPGTSALRTERILRAALLSAESGVAVAPQ